MGYCGLWVLAFGCSVSYDLTCLDMLALLMGYTETLFLIG